MPQTRRQFITTAACAALAAPLGRAIAKETTDTPVPPINVFSKHLQFLDYREMAAKAAEIGFAGVDVTVRPNGHVLPENVQRDLPRAYEAIRSAGIDLSMMTTAVDDANDPVDRAVLKQASELGIQYYRMNWFRYTDDLTLPESLAVYRQKVDALNSLNQTLNIVGCYQNHAGMLVGASLWEVWQLLQTADQDHMGIQYDIRHATVEGGLSWPNGLRLALPHIKTVAIKDFKWATKDGRATVVNTPIGQGMVDFPRYFRILKEKKIYAPMSLHLEYDLGGAESGARELSGSPDAVYNAMRKDLDTIKRLWAAA